MAAHVRDDDAVAAPVRQHLHHRGDGQRPRSLVSLRARPRHGLRDDGGLSLFGCQPIVDLCQDPICVPDDGNIHLDGLFDLGRVDVYLDEACKLLEFLIGEHRPISEARPHRRNNVGILKRPNGRLAAVHPDHPEVILEVLGHCRFTHEGREDRRPQEP